VLLIGMAKNPYLKLLVVVLEKGLMQSARSQLEYPSAYNSSRTRNRIRLNVLAEKV